MKPRAYQTRRAKVGMFVKNLGNVTTAQIMTEFGITCPMANRDVTALMEVGVLSRLPGAVRGGGLQFSYKVTS